MTSLAPAVPERTVTSSMLSHRHRRELGEQILKLHVTKGSDTEPKDGTHGQNGQSDP